MPDELKWIDSPPPVPPQPGGQNPPSSSWPSKLLTLVLQVGAAVGLLALGLFAFSWLGGLLALLFYGLGHHGHHRARRQGMTIGKARSALYGTARLLGDINAVQRGTVPQRLARRLLGKVIGRGLFGRLFR